MCKEVGPGHLFHILRYHALANRLNGALLTALSTEYTYYSDHKSNG